MCCFTVFYAKEGGKLGFEDAIDKLELLQPQFVMSVGDLIDGKINDSIFLDEQWNEFNVQLPTIADEILPQLKVSIY
jgi:hypothetical protein